jgi:hypothetical protein
MAVQLCCERQTRSIQVPVDPLEFDTLDDVMMSFSAAIRALGGDNRGLDVEGGAFSPPRPESDRFESAGPMGR